MSQLINGPFDGAPWRSAVPGERAIVFPHNPTWLEPSHHRSAALYVWSDEHKRWFFARWVRQCEDWFALQFPGEAAKYKQRKRSLMDLILRREV